jgi:hypothetical protein
MAKVVDKAGRDVLITQTREARRILRLRVLGLTGAGTSRVLASRNALVRRLAASLARQDYVRLDPLASSAWRYAERTLATEPSTVTYEVSRGEALHFGYGKFEHFQVEPASGGVALAWSTLLPLEVLLERLRPFLQGTGDAELHVNVKGSFRESVVPADQAIAVLLDEEQPRFWRLDIPERAITWERDADTRIADLPFGLMGYITDRHEPEYLSALVTATATPRIGRSAEALLGESEETIRLALAARPDEERL